MLYRLLKFPAKIALLIWCRHLRINNKIFLQAEGPLLIAANHPNSFLDAILLCTIFRRPVYSLARGDAFTNSFYNRLLRSMNMLPVYRISEGSENLEHNYKTFEDCIGIFKQNGIVLIFSEGQCINEWNLRALKKGTARLILDAWQQNIPLKILPAGINYSSFTSFGKNVQLNFGDILSAENFPFAADESFGSKVQVINDRLKKQLTPLVVQVKPPNKKTIREIFEVPLSFLKKLLLSIPAGAGVLLHAPLYLPVRYFARKKFGRIDHYDSVVVGALFMLYPVYLLLIAFALYHFTGRWALLISLFPFTAWSLVQVKKQI